LIKGPFKAVPAYVDAIGGHLQDRIQAIDDAFEKSGDVVRYEKNGPSCQGGRVDGASVQFIKSLHEDDYVKRNVFRAACHGGMNSAIQQYVAGKLDYVE
jgi:hypothetical protein